MAQRYRFAGRGDQRRPAHGSRIGAHGSSSVALVFAADDGAGKARCRAGTTPGHRAGAGGMPRRSKEHQSAAARLRRDAESRSGMLRASCQP
jgi:hypothetical protein